MRKITKYASAIYLTVLMNASKSVAQCSFASSNGYTVSITVSPVSVVAPNSCQWGYNYNLSLSYNVTFLGSNIPPAGLYTLQGNILCGGTPNFFSLPLTGGSGTVTTVSNPYINTSDCLTATPSTLNCNTAQIIIEGPGIATQTAACAMPATLPITLKKFNARNMEDNSIYLFWETASETNNHFFVVERSTDAISWQGIKTIAGAGNSQTAQQYFYFDKNLNPGKYYYRLKQVDVAGSHTFSNTVSAEVAAGNADIYISDVSGSGSQLFIGGITNVNDWQVSVLSATASLVMKPAMLNGTILNIPEVSTGIYLLKLQNKVDGRVKTIRFVKQ